MSFKFNPCAPCCDTCTGVNTTISGRVSIVCAYAGLAGFTVTATGPMTVSTTTNALGDYTLVITKKGTYTVTATGPCGTLSQSVTKNTCGAATTGINFTFPQVNLSITYDFPCWEEGNGSRPYTWFYKAGTTPPGLPAFPSLNKTSNQCVQPGDYIYKVYDRDCFIGKEVPITVGCANTSTTVNIEKRTYSIKGQVYSCNFWGPARGASVTVSGDGGGGSATVDGDGNYEVSGLIGDCYYTITVSGDRWVTQTATYYLNCGGTLDRDFVLEPKPGYYCYGNCCSQPFTNLRVVDSQGSHPVNMGTLLTDCIIKQAEGYPIAANFGGQIGILCRPYDPPTSDGYGTYNIAYRYRVTCGTPATGTPIDQWSVIRYVCGCYRRPVPFPSGPGHGYFPVDSYCGPDGWPRATTGSTEYYPSGEAKTPPQSTCGAFNLSYSGFLFGLGDATLIAD